MKRFALVMLLLGFLTGILTAQATIVVSGTHVTDNNTNLLTGQLTFIVTDTSDNPIAYTPEGGSPTTAAIIIPVKRGAVQYVNGFPPTIPNPATMSPSGTNYRILVQGPSGAPTYLTLPFTNITQSFFSYDSYSAPPGGLTIHGIGFPRLPCTPSAMYHNESASDPYPWVCSRLPTGDVYWTQNPSNNPACQGTAQAAVSPSTGPIFCTDSQNAWVTPGLVFAGPAQGTTVPGPLSVTPYTGSCTSATCVTQFAANNQNIVQADTTQFGVNASNASTPFSFISNVSGITPAGNAGSQANNGFVQVYNAWGLGKNTGNPPGIECDSTHCDQGWNVQGGATVVMNDYKDGISEGLLDGNCNHYAAGDTNCLYFYPTVVGGNEDASGEGNSLFKINGSGTADYYNGSVLSTTGTGDQNPGLTQTARMYSGAFMVDVSKPKAIGNFAGNPTAFNDGSGGNDLNLLIYPVTGTMVPSTGMCKSTVYMQGNDYTQENLVTRQETCSVIGGLNLSAANGPVWQVSSGVVERVVISNVVTTGSTQTFNVTGRKPASIGSYFFQGGTNGVIRFEDDFNSAAHLFTAFYVFGATDSTHILMTTLYTGVYNRSNPLATGSYQETQTSPFTIFDAARVVSLNSQGAEPSISPNTIPFAVGDNIAVPPNPAYVEAGITFVSTGHLATNPSVGGTGISVQLAGNGETYANSYTGISLDTAGTNIGLYNCTGCGGKLWPFTGIFVGNNGTGKAPIGSILSFDQPVDGNVALGGCGGGVVLCNLGPDPTRAFDLYAEQNSGHHISIDIPNVEVSSDLGFAPGFVRTNQNIANEYFINGANVPVGQYLRGNDGSGMTPSTIQAADLPVDNSTIINTGGSLKTKGFSGSCASTTTLTVVNGTVQGCS